MSDATLTASQLPFGDGMQPESAWGAGEYEDTMPDTENTGSKPNRPDSTIQYTPDSKVAARLEAFKAKQQRKTSSQKKEKAKIPFGYNRNSEAKREAKQRASNIDREAKKYADTKESRKSQPDGTVTYYPSREVDERLEAFKAKQAGKAKSSGEGSSNGSKKTKRQSEFEMRTGLTLTEKEERKARAETSTPTMSDSDETMNGDDVTEAPTSELQGLWDAMMSPRLREYHQAKRKATMRPKVYPTSSVKFSDTKSEGTSAKGPSIPKSAMQSKPTEWTTNGPRKKVRPQKKKSWVPSLADETDYERNQRLGTSMQGATGRSDGKAGQMQESKEETIARRKELLSKEEDQYWFNTYFEGHRPRLPIALDCAMEDFPDINGLKDASSKSIERAAKSGKISSQRWLTGELISKETASKLGVDSITWEDSYDQTRFLSGVRKLVEGGHQIVLPQEDLDTLKSHLEGYTVVRKTPHQLKMEADGSMMTDLKAAMKERVSIAPFTMQDATDHLGEDASALDFVIVDTLRHKNGTKATSKNSTLKGESVYTTYTPAKHWEQKVGPYTLLRAEELDVSDEKFDFDDWANRVIRMPNPTLVAEDETHKAALERQIQSELQRLVKKPAGCDPWTCLNRLHTSCLETRTGLTTEKIIEMVKQGDTTYADGFRLSRKGKPFLTWNADKVSATTLPTDAQMATASTIASEKDLGAELSEIMSDFQAEDAIKARNRELLEIINRFKTAQSSGVAPSEITIPDGVTLSKEEKEVWDAIRSLVSGNPAVTSQQAGGNTLGTCASEMGPQNTPARQSIAMTA